MRFRKRKDRPEGHSWFGLHEPFDPRYRAVTSGIVQPHILFAIRLILAIYAVVASLVDIILYQKNSGVGYSLYYAFFTRLTYCGITAYFCVAAFHSGVFVLSLRRAKSGADPRAPWFPLQKWGKVLQFLHMGLFSTIITMPVVVTVVFWLFLSGPTTFATTYGTWSNISFHAMNTVFLAIEFVFGRMRLHWGYLLFCIVVMAFYLALVYLVHAVDNIWVYKFFDPTAPNAKVPVFIIGILIAEIVVFAAMWGLIHIRDWIFPRGRGVRVVDQNHNSSSIEGTSQRVSL